MRNYCLTETEFQFCKMKSIPEMGSGEGCTTMGICFIPLKYTLKMVKTVNFTYTLHACMLSCFSRVQPFVTLWTVARQAPLSMGLSRQEYWSGLPCSPPGDLSNPMIEPISPASPSLQVDSLPMSHRGSPYVYIITI